MIIHLDGRKFLSATERARRGIPPADFRYRLAEFGEPATEARARSSAGTPCL